MVAEGDKVAVRWIAEGTRRGELFGIPPTGKYLRGASAVQLSLGGVTVGSAGLLASSPWLPRISRSGGSAHVSRSLFLNLAGVLVLVWASRQSASRLQPSDG